MRHLLALLATLFLSLPAGWAFAGDELTEREMDQVSAAGPVADAIKDVLRPAIIEVSAKINSQAKLIPQNLKAELVPIVAGLRHTFKTFFICPQVGGGCGQGLMAKR